MYSGDEIFLLPSASVPDFYGLVEWGGGEEPGVWGEEHLVDQSAVSSHPGQRLLVFRRVPQEQGEIIGPGHQELRSWTLQRDNKSQGPDTRGTWTHQHRPEAVPTLTLLYLCKALSFSSSTGGKENACYMKTSTPESLSFKRSANEQTSPVSSTESHMILTRPSEVLGVNRGVCGFKRSSAQDIVCAESQGVHPMGVALQSPALDPLEPQVNTH